MWSGDSKDEVAAVAHTNGSNENATEVTKVSDNPKVQLAPKERRNVRERSMSVPCRSEASDVNSVMTKAKRASSYLWMLLHSQVGASHFSVREFKFLNLTHEVLIVAND